MNFKSYTSAAGLYLQQDQKVLYIKFQCSLIYGSLWLFQVFDILMAFLLVSA